MAAPSRGAAARHITGHDRYQTPGYAPKDLLKLYIYAYPQPDLVKPSTGSRTRFRSDRAAAAFEAKLQDHSRFLASGLMLGSGTKLNLAASMALWVHTGIVSRLPLPA